MALRFRNRTERSQPRHESSTEPNIAPLTLTQRHEEAEMSKIEHAALLAGRLIFGGYFLYSGIRHFTDLEMMASYAKSKGIAWPNIAVLGSGSMLVIGGLSLLTGVKPKVGAGLVTAFLAGAERASSAACREPRARRPSTSPSRGPGQGSGSAAATRTPRSAAPAAARSTTRTTRPGGRSRNTHPRR